MIPLYDPPREDSAETIASARQMGVKVKMVTGDQVAIGREIARQLDLGTNILDASMLTATTAAQAGRLADAIEAADGFAQVFPEHKYQIVEALQARKHIVGMTGDGVNDAPALKKADAGIAVAGATDAARAAADIVLLTPGLSVIIDAIRESRKIFQRMNSYAIYRIAETIRVLLFMTLSILVFNFYPVTAVMIVLLALLNDGAILSIAYDRVHYSVDPEAWNMHMVLGIATVLGIAGVIASFGLFYLGERVFHSEPRDDPDPDVPETVGRRAPDHLRHPHAPAVLVDSPGQPAPGRRAGHADGCHPDCRLWPVHGPHRLGLGRARLGLCAGLVLGQRSRQAGRLSHFRCPATCASTKNPIDKRKKLLHLWRYAVTQPVSTQSPRQKRGGGSWRRVLISAVAFYVLGLVILILTGNPNLFPTVVMLGSFMVPAAYVAFFYDHRHLSKLTVSSTALSFFYGGVLGTFAASLLEPLFIRQLDFLTAFQVGLIEEFVKILGVLVIARRVRHDAELDGLVLGAAAGMGFAALESTGYAFSAFLSSQGSLSATVGVTLLRGLLSPLGHGTWTAILAGVLFRESQGSHFRVNMAVIGAYLGVVVLHGLWDGLPGLLSQFVSSGFDIMLAQSLVGAAGLFVLWRRWREARRLQEVAALTVLQPASAAMDLETPGIAGAADTQEPAKVENIVPDAEADAVEKTLPS